MSAPAATTATHSICPFSSIRRHVRRRGRTPRPASAVGGGDDVAGESYLDMWKRALDRQRRSVEFGRLSAQTPAPAGGDERTERFNRILHVPAEERDRAQRLQVIDRAAAAIAAVQSLLREAPPQPQAPDGGFSSGVRLLEGEALHSATGITITRETPGPDFWSWSPPTDTNSKSRYDYPRLKPARKTDSSPQESLLDEKERTPFEFLAIPLESLLQQKKQCPLPPLQSLLDLEKTSETVDAEETEIDTLFADNAAEAAEALNTTDLPSSHGVHLNGTKWWKDTGTEQRPDGMVCKWTLIRGVSADGAVEWENKYWEASDEFDRKELGSEKSGRDAFGNVWREFWKESMWLDFACGLMHIEKTADKWGKNGNGGEWQEKWQEHYNGSGKADKWAHKWCRIDPATPLDAGHAHIWHERWGETYDGHGGTTKYTDKWAERSEGDGGWSKWGDKWDEHFEPNSHGVKQGETWWEGSHGDRWNRTWGEKHNGSGWLHKYGRSSSGEHWDTHVKEDTWYAGLPHYGFDHCLDNSPQLRAVPRRIAAA